MTGKTKSKGDTHSLVERDDVMAHSLVNPPVNPLVNPLENNREKYLEK